MQDITGKEVLPGDLVAVVIKTYGCAKLKSADLKVCRYFGKGPYGHEFQQGRSTELKTIPIRLRDTQLVKIEEE